MFPNPSPSLPPTATHLPASVMTQPAIIIRSGSHPLCGLLADFLLSRHAMVHRAISPLQRWGEEIA